MALRSRRGNRKSFDDNELHSYYDDIVVLLAKTAALPITPIFAKRRDHATPTDGFFPGNFEKTRRRPRK
jgi:hypothetical protein